MSEDEFPAMRKYSCILYPALKLTNFPCLSILERVLDLLRVGALYEGLVGYFSSLPSTNPGYIKVLLTTPTEKQLITSMV